MHKPASNICWSRVQMEGSFPQRALSHTMGTSHVCRHFSTPCLQFQLPQLSSPPSLDGSIRAPLSTFCKQTWGRVLFWPEGRLCYLSPGYPEYGETQAWGERVAMAPQTHRLPPTWKDEVRESAEHDPLKGWKRCCQDKLVCPGLRVVLEIDFVPYKCQTLAFSLYLSVSKPTLPVFCKSGAL